MGPHQGPSLRSQDAEWRCRLHPRLQPGSVRVGDLLCHADLRADCLRHDNADRGRREQGRLWQEKGAGCRWSRPTLLLLQSHTVDLQVQGWWISVQLPIQIIKAELVGMLQI